MRVLQFRIKFRPILIPFILLLFFFCSDQENHKLRTTKSAVGLRRKIGGAGAVQAAGKTKKGPFRTAKTTDEVKSIQEEETYRVQFTCRLNGSFHFFIE